MEGGAVCGVAVNLQGVHASVTLSQTAIEKTAKLVEFLADVTAAVERDPVCDILEGVCCTDR